MYITIKPVIENPATFNYNLENAEACLSKVFLIIPLILFSLISVFASDGLALLARPII